MGKALGRQDRKGYWTAISAGHRLPRYGEVLQQRVRHGSGSYEVRGHLDKATLAESRFDTPMMKERGKLGMNCSDWGNIFLVEAVRPLCYQRALVCYKKKVLSSPLSSFFEPQQQEYGSVVPHILNLLRLFPLYSVPFYQSTQYSTYLLTTEFIRA